MNKKSDPKTIVFVIVLIISFMATWFIFNKYQERKRENEIGISALGLKSFGVALDHQTLTNLEGKGSFSAKPEKVQLINFWATWCAPCIEEMPSLIRLARDFSEDIEIIGINLDKEKSKLDKFLKKNPLNFKVKWDPEGNNSAKKIGVVKYPESILYFNSKKKYLIVGPRDWDDKYLRSYLKSLINK